MNGYAERILKTPKLKLPIYRNAIFNFFFFGILLVVGLKYYSYSYFISLSLSLSLSLTHTHTHTHTGLDQEITLGHGGNNGEA